MGNSLLIEESLQSALDRARGPDGPATLAEAMEYAVFPGGARLRPQLCLAVAATCSAGTSRTDGANLAALVPATALELLHCASLVHDDLPCFDDAPLRRGKPSVHAVYGEAMAVLVGDALIMLAVDTVVRGLGSEPARLAPVLTAVVDAVGAPNGIIAGQAWEAEADVDVEVYHRTKTAALFVGACCAGALSVGADPGPWRTVGLKIGEAYQALDDLKDVFATAREIGKPVAQDLRLKRPSVLDVASPEAVAARIRRSLKEALDAVPVEADASHLARLLDGAVGGFLATLDRSRAA